MNQSPMSSTSTENLLRKSTGLILKSNYTHFFLLSVLFLLPIFFTLIIYPSFHLALFQQFSIFEVIVPCFYTLFLLIFFIFAVASFTYSAVEIFYGRSITLSSSIKSIRNSFFPLLFTLIVSLTIFVSIALFFALVTLFSVQILETFGGIRLGSKQLLYLVIFASIVLVPVFVWMQVNWSLAYVIAVVESKWGFETLRKSARLVKGKRWVVFWMILLHDLIIGGLVIGGSLYLVTVDAAKGDNWRSLAVISQTAECSVMGFWMMNLYLVMQVALYMYCNGEKMHLDVGKDDEYVSLPLDDDKNDHASV